MPLVDIDNLNDPRIDDYRNVREADLVGRRGLFIAEGPLVVRRLIEESPFPCRSMLLARKRVGAMEREVAALGARAPDAPVLVASQRVMDAIVGFPIHRGVLAVGERAETTTLADALGAPLQTQRTIVALEGLANHDNVGGVFRNAAAFGVDQVAFDARTCDPLYRKAIRVSIGCALTLPFARVERWPGAPAGSSDMRAAGGLAQLDEAGFVTIALTPARDAIALSAAMEDVPPVARVALLLGEEGAGLTAETLAQANIRARIDTTNAVDSLNVANAGAIAMHMLRQRRNQYASATSDHDKP